MRPWRTALVYTKPASVYERVSSGPFVFWRFSASARLPCPCGTPRHKLIVWKDPARSDELYDLVADPAEAHNLVAEPAAQEVLRDLRSRLLVWKRNADPALSWPAKP
ncbi:MAG TPA: sulfatase/phosphatase domain-containing protein [Thermoanaerobaculia bacterium]